MEKTGLKARTEKTEKDRNFSPVSVSIFGKILYLVQTETDRPGPISPLVLTHPWTLEFRQNLEKSLCFKWFIKDFQILTPA